MKYVCVDIHHILDFDNINTLSEAIFLGKCLKSPLAMSCWNQALS